MRRAIFTAVSVILLAALLTGCGGYSVSMATYKSRGMIVYANALTPPPVDGQAQPAPDFDDARAMEALNAVAAGMGVELVDISAREQADDDEQDTAGDDGRDQSVVYSDEAVTEVTTGNVDLCICALPRDAGFSKTLYYSQPVDSLGDGTDVYIVAAASNTVIVEQLKKAAG